MAATPRPREELMQLASADIGISVALEHATEGRGELKDKQAAIQGRMKALQREINRPKPRPANPEGVSPTVERQQALGKPEGPARKGVWLRVPAESRWGSR